MILKFSCSILFLTAHLFLFALSPLEARWALEGDANVECLQSDTTYKVDKFGKWTMEFDIHAKILNEAGRQALSVLTFTYDATRSTLEVLEAKTSAHGNEFIVPKQKIEDKPLASDPLGLREEHQILIPFEQVSIGSIVHLKLRRKLFKTDFENYYYNSVAFGGDYLWRNASVTFESALPLFFKVNDPQNLLQVTENKEGPTQVLRIKLKKPLFRALVGEFNAFLDPETKTYVSVSTEKNYERVGKIQGKQYQPILTEQLPTVLDSIRIAASKIKDETACIDTIVSHLIEKIHYLGNWNSAEGNLVPRTLTQIVTTGYGDCKEYSACLAAILNALGYQARIALVQRGEIYLEENNLPGINAFNHAIVKAISPSGKTYWIDPTNITTMADGIYPDIADRPALVLDPNKPEYEHIPPVDYHHARSQIEQTITLRDDGYVATQGSFCLQGEKGHGFTQELIMNQPSVLKEHVIKTLCRGADPINPILTLPVVTSRKVETLKSTYSYAEENTLIHTNLGYAFPLESTWHQPYVETSQKHEGAIFVGHPETRVKKTIFKRANAENLNNLEFSIQTPWLNAKREVFVSDEGITVTETVEQLTSVISAKDLKSPQFEELRKTLRKYCDGAAVIFSTLSTDESD
ncbi:MAG: DUF3857 domain-containing protein [Proteobacteria bacterium]|nr:DUF3857 domain-containing protein [Pseudomonadota bacterium]